MQLSFLLLLTVGVVVGLWRWWPSRSIWPAPMTMGWMAEKERETWKNGWRL